MYHDPPILGVINEYERQETGTFIVEECRQNRFKTEYLQGEDLIYGNQNSNDRKDSL